MEDRLGCALDATIHDFGQNSGGYVAFTVTGGRGARVTVEHAEILDKNRDIDNANYRSAEARCEYIRKGGAPESYRPLFSCFGFRYARVTITGRAKISAIALVPITSVHQVTASFTSANPLVDRLFQNTIWSQRANFIDVPTDCPQRDERLGWTSVAQGFAPTACYLADAKGFLEKYVRDMIADQRENGAIAHVSPDPTRGHEAIMPNFYGSTGWGDAICVVPLVLYDHCGDASIVSEALPAMERWNDFVWSISDGPIVMPPRALAAPGFSFGDWLQPKGDSGKPLPAIGDDAAAKIYLYISSALTARAARLVGNAVLASRMEARAAQVKAALQREFISASGRLVYDDQTSYALAILHDLIPAELLARSSRYFKATFAGAEGRIGTGFIGTPALLPTLVKIGEAELAAAVFLQEAVPGWLYQVKTGATTIWERGDAIMANGLPFDPSMNSYNHYAYSAVCQRLLEAVAGFRPDRADPGFRHIIFEPVIVPSLSPVAAHHDAARGRIEAARTLAGNQGTYDGKVPKGAKGTLVLSKAYSNTTLDGAALGERQCGAGGGRAPRDVCDELTGKDQTRGRLPRAKRQEAMRIPTSRQALLRASAAARLGPPRDQPVQRQGARSDGDDGEGNGGPIEVEIRPGIRHHQLDHRRHRQKPQGGQPGAKAKDQQHGQAHLGAGGQEGDLIGHRDRIFTAKDMQLERLLKQVGCGWRKLKHPVPTGHPRAPERQGQRDAQDRLRDGQGSAGKQGQRATEPGGKTRAGFSLQYVHWKTPDGTGAAVCHAVRPPDRNSADRALAKSKRGVARKPAVAASDRVPPA